MHRESDRFALWNAQANSALDRIDAVLGDEAEHASPAPSVHSSQLASIVNRAMLRTPPPPGRVIRPTGPNMGPQPDRPDHWDAFECRFDDGES